jgi:hypothetical protein
MRSVPRGNSWNDTLYDFRKQAEALPEGPQKAEMLEKARRLEHAIAFRTSLGSSHGHEQAQG